MALLRNAFPVGGFNARSRTPYVTSLDLTDEADQWRLVLELSALRLADAATGYYYGAASSRTGFVRGRAELGGWASMGKGWDTELAHEVGHSFDLLHAPCGGALSTDPDYPYRDGSIGVWGYDFRDGSLVDPIGRKDIMGYCYELGWISDFFFKKALEYRLEREAPGARGPTAASSAREETLIVWGGALNGEAVLEPPFRLRAAPLLPEGMAGSYRVEGFDAAGGVRFSLSFEPTEDKFGDKYFLFAIPLGSGAAEVERIVLAGPDGSAEIAVGAASAIGVVTERGGGRLRGLLRDWSGELPPALRGAPGLEVSPRR